MKLGKTNKEYKDRLFKFIFGNPENREWTLELYNAVNGSSYDNPEDIVYNTIEDVIYMHMKNDISFLIRNEMNLYEQQSTYCPNMPLRFLIYLVKLYEAYIQKNNLNIYSTVLQYIPRPRCVCFYNGLDEKSDKSILKLSGMYYKDANKIDNETGTIVELEVEMININYGHNKKLLKRCEPLYEYSFFVDRIRFHINELKEEDKNYTLEDAIDRAIKDLPKDFKILEFIMKNREEVKAMCLFEYDEERHMRQEREEGIEIGMKKGMKKGMEKGMKKGREEGIEIGVKRGREEGREEGMKRGREEGMEKGREKNMLEMVRDGFLPIEEAAKRLGITADEVKTR